jgi:hypothetical protein
MTTGFRETKYPAPPLTLSSPRRDAGGTYYLRNALGFEPLLGR